MSIKPAKNVGTINNGMGDVGCADTVYWKIVEDITKGKKLKEVTMPRPKANTEAGRIATEKWRKTMIEKYGSEEAFKHAIRCMGSLGGRVKTSKPKGFAANPKLARKAGRKGGSISRRGKSNNTRELLAKNHDKIKEMLAQNYSVKRIAQAVGIPESTLYKKVRENDLG